MSEIITAEVFLKQCLIKPNQNNILALKQFAEMHVKLALQAASEKVTCDVFYEEWENEELILDKERNIEGSYVFPYLRTGMVVDVNKESILNSYNSENIK